jgi:hypothetical protein
VVAESRRRGVHVEKSPARDINQATQDVAALASLMSQGDITRPRQLRNYCKFFHIAVSAGRFASILKEILDISHGMTLPLSSLQEELFSKCIPMPLSLVNDHLPLLRYLSSGRCYALRRLRSPCGRQHYDNDNSQCKPLDFGWKLRGARRISRE